jgi:hypothetical protein
VKRKHKVLTLIALAVASQAPNVAAAQMSELDQRVCKRVEETGSRLGGGKICLTRREWEQRMREDQKTVFDMQKASTKMKAGSGQ